MRERWATFWKSAGAACGPEPAWRDLSARYGEPHRAYHTLRHIGQCLGEFDRVHPLARDPAVVELALWYHDAVYDPRKRDNEERSALLAAAAAMAIGFAPARAVAAAELIRVSTHRKVSEDPDARLFADIDLSILGQTPELFDEYERQVRVEYGWVPEADFRSGRAAILKSFVDRPFLYGTAPFREKYEGAARRNLAESIPEACLTAVEKRFGLATESPSHRAELHFYRGGTPPIPLPRDFSSLRPALFSGLLALLFLRGL